MSPREKFRSNRALARGFNDLISSPQMQAALDAAGQEYDQNLTIATDVTSAAANRWRKEGADGFRRTLENLNANSVTATPPSPSTLDHKV